MGKSKHFHIFLFCDDLLAASIFNIKWLNPNISTFFCFVTIFLVQELYATVFPIELNITWNQTPCWQMKSSCNWNSFYQLLKNKHISVSAVWIFTFIPSFKTFNSLWRGSRKNDASGFLAYTISIKCGQIYIFDDLNNSTPSAFHINEMLSGFAKNP